MVASEAYAACLRLAREHYENFPVASWLMPADARPHIAAVYAFARIADDMADEGSQPAEQRLAALADWQTRLDLAARGSSDETGNHLHDAVFAALVETLRRHDVEQMRALLSDLLSAFAQDVTKTRYDKWDDVLDYCRRSANPVGRLVLMVTGHKSAEVDTLSDHVCTALQLTNFWQDLAQDWGRGRLYVPLDTVQSHRAGLDDLTAGRWTREWKEALQDVGERTRHLFEAGRPVADATHGRLRWELRATWLGGRRILDRLAASQYDVFRARPSLTWRDGVAIAAGAVRWNRSG